VRPFAMRWSRGPPNRTWVRHMVWPDAIWPFCAARQPSISRCRPHHSPRRCPDRRLARALRLGRGVNHFTLAATPARLCRLGAAATSATWRQIGHWSDAGVCRSTCLPWRGGHASTLSHPGRWATDSQPTATPEATLAGKWHGQAGASVARDAGLHGPAMQIGLGATRTRVTASRRRA
jgi:hypothetical protein